MLQSSVRISSRRTASFLERGDIVKENKLNSRLVLISGLSVLPEIKRMLEEIAYHKGKTLVGLFREEIIPMYLKKERR